MQVPTHRPYRFLLTTQVMAGIASLALGCGGGGEGLTEPTTGNLEIATATTGESPDPDGYTVALDSGAPQPVAVSATYTFVSVSPGDHAVTLAGIDAPCVVSGDNPRPVTVSAGVQARIDFAIDCTAPVISQWSKMTTGTAIPLYAVWGSSAANVFGVGYHLLDDIGMFSESVILRYNGSAWSATEDPTDLLQQVWLTGVSGSSPDDVFAVGEGFDDQGGASFGAILHFNGTTWARMDGPVLAPELDAALYSVSSSSATEAYAVGFTFNVMNGEENATALSYGASGWTATTVPGSDHLVLRDIWSHAGEGAFAVGDDATVPDTPVGAALRWDGSKWEALPGAGDLPLKAVWGTSAADVFAVGDNGTIRHFDGTALSAMTSPTSETLVDVYGNGPRDVFAVGLSGTVIHFDGTSWKAQDSGGAEGLFGVWTAAADGFAVGDAGRIIRGAIAPVADIQPSLAAQRRAMVRRNIGREALNRKWPFPGRRGY